MVRILKEIMVMEANQARNDQPVRLSFSSKLSDEASSGSFSMFPAATKRTVAARKARGRTRPSFFSGTMESKAFLLRNTQRTG